jgi:predicted RNA-binding Zn ribbon-like protein
LRRATVAGGRATLRSARGLRQALREVFTAVVERRPPRAPDLALISRTLVAALAQQRIVHHGQSVAWQWADDAGVAERILGPVARSAAEVLASADLGRVRRCAGPGCGWFFFDLTRNHTRRWCNMARCGNRAKARRFYARRIKARGQRRAAGRSAPGRQAGIRSPRAVRARPRP